MGIRGASAARCFRYSAYRPMRQDCGVRTRHAQVIDNLLHRHDHARCRERSLLLYPGDALDEDVACAVRPLRVDDRKVRSNGRNGSEPLTGKRALDKTATRVDPDELRALVSPKDSAGQPRCTRSI